MRTGPAPRWSSSTQDSSLLLLRAKVLVFVHSPGVCALSSIFLTSFGLESQKPELGPDSAASHPCISVGISSSRPRCILKCSVLKYFQTWGKVMLMMHRVLRYPYPASPQVCVTCVSQWRKWMVTFVPAVDQPGGLLPQVPPIFPISPCSVQIRCSP